MHQCHSLFVTSITTPKDHIDAAVRARDKGMIQSVVQAVRTTGIKQFDYNSALRANGIGGVPTLSVYV